MTKSKTQPKNWRKVKLGDVAELTPGYAFKGGDFSSNGLPVIKIKNIASGFLDFNNTDYYSGDINNLEKYIIKKGDILVSMTGSHASQWSSVVGKIARNKSDKIFLMNQRVGKIKPNAKLIDNDYLYFCLWNDETTLSLANRASGSANQANISPEIIKSLEIIIPSLAEQKTIASFFSSIDDKIELNNKINQNLEQAAQVIFKEWFVNSKNSKNWKTKKITEIIKRLPVGKKYDNKTAFSKGKIPVLDQGQSGFIGYHNDQPGVKASVESPVVIFTNHTCNYRLMTCDFSCIQNVLPYVGDKDYSTLFVYFLTKGKIKMQEYKGHWPEFEEQVFLIPPPLLAQKFTDYIKPVIEKMVGIENENQKLASLRDLLLPKLMSGEIRV